MAGRNSVLEALEAEIPTKTAYVAEGAERDDRLREIFKLAAGRGIALLEVTRAELDRLTGGAVHQGVALQCLRSSTPTPTTCWLPPWTPTGAVDRRSRLDHRPAQPRGGGAVGGRLRGPRRPHPGAAVGGDDRRRLEDLGRRRRPAADRPGDQPQPHACAAYADAGLTLVGLDGEADTAIDDVAEVSGPLVLIVGSEGAGLSRLVRRRATAGQRSRSRRRSSR